MDSCTNDLLGRSTGSREVSQERGKKTRLTVEKVWEMVWETFFREDLWCVKEAAEKFMHQFPPVLVVVGPVNNLVFLSDKSLGTAPFDAQVKWNGMYASLLCKLSQCSLDNISSNRNLKGMNHLQPRVHLPKRLEWSLRLRDNGPSEYNDPLLAW